MEPEWFERGVRDAIRIRINNPTLNKYASRYKDAGRYNLPHVWNNTLRALERGGGKVQRPPTRSRTLTMSPVPQNLEVDV